MKKLLVFLLVAGFVNNCYGDDFADFGNWLQKQGKKAKSGVSALGRGIKAAAVKEDIAEFLSTKITFEVKNKVDALKIKIRKKEMQNCPGLQDALVVINDLNQTLIVLEDIVPKEISRELNLMIGSVNSLIESVEAVQSTAAGKGIVTKKAEELESNARGFAQRAEALKEKEKNKKWYQ